MRHLALTLLLAMPAVALWAAQPPYIHFTPATGPVTHYEARVRTLTSDVRYLSPDATPVVELAMLPLSPWWIDVRACSLVRCAEWSDYTPHTADLDANGAVGISDFGVLAQEWGQPERGVSMLGELAQRWGARTVWDEKLEVRRYE